MQKVKVSNITKIGNGQYAMVKDRIMALRNSDQRYSLVTDTQFLQGVGWLCKATLTIMDTGEMYTGESFTPLNRGTSIQRNFPVEDASTSAIGRALAAAGIGIEESFSSYDEMIKAEEIARGQTDTKVAEVLGELTGVIEKNSDKAIKPIPKMRKLEEKPVVEVDPLEEPEVWQKPTGEVYNDNFEKAIDQTRETGEVITEEDTIEEDIPSSPTVSREEVAADDSPVLTGEWEKKEREPKRKKKEEEKPTRSPQTVEEITGKGITDHMKEVFVRCMEKGVNPFDYPERNTDKKFDAIEAAVNRGELEFNSFVIREWGVKFANLHRKDKFIVEQDTFEEPVQPIKLESGKTIAETIYDMNHRFMPPLDPKIKKDLEKEIKKQDTEMKMPETPVNTGGMQPNKNFDSQGKGGTMAENLTTAGNKFGMVIAPYEDRQIPHKFMKFVTSLVNKGVDVEVFETKFLRHHLSSEFPSFEALLREGAEAQINEFLNYH